MNLKLFFLSIFLFPLLLGAMSIEEEAGKILGQSYNSEAAKQFFKRLQIQPEFPVRSTFTYNFYEIGLSIKVTGVEFIQAIQVYNKTMLFKTFPELVYGKKLSEVYDVNDVYRVIKMAPVAEDKASGTFVYPNNKPADYLIRVIRKKDNTMRSIAWMMDDNKMEKIIAEANPFEINSFNSHENVWELLGQPLDSEISNTFRNSSLGFQYKTSKYSRKIGMHLGIFNIDGVKSYKYIEFKRRGQFGTRRSFPYALPEGLHWWSSPEDFAKIYKAVISDPASGTYTFEKQTDKGIMTMQFSMGILNFVKFQVKRK